MSHRLVVIFAEDPNDAQALEHLLRYIVPNVGTIRKPRQPLVLIKGRLPPAARRNAASLVEQVQREAVARKQPVSLVIAHQDCDAVEPAHVTLATRITDELRRCGAPNPVAAVPAWELEAWWYLWPDAVAAVCPSWRRLTRGGAVGMLKDAKEQLRRDLRPLKGKRVPDYQETDAPRIAEMVRTQNQQPAKTVQSGSWEAFRQAVAP